MANCSRWGAEYLLAYRATRVTNKIGKQLRDIAAIWLGGVWEEPWPLGLAAYFNASDNGLLRTAVVLCDFFPESLNDNRTVHSFADLPKFPSSQLGGI